MAFVTLGTMLPKAYQGYYAVGAFNVIDLGFLEAIILAARHTASPVVLNIAEVHFPFKWRSSAVLARLPAMTKGTHDQHDVNKKKLLTEI